jgi:hypothetical protein
VSSGDQLEQSPHLNDHNDGPRTSAKDGAIELCFQLLSSGRRLNEILSELANSSTPNGGNSESEVAANPSTGPLPGAAALIVRTEAEPPLPAIDRALQRPDPVRSEVADCEKSVGGGYSFLGDGQLADIRLPAVYSWTAQPERTREGRLVRAAGLIAARRRALARAGGALLVCGSVLAAVPSVTYEPPATRHSKVAKQPQASAVDQPSAASGGASSPPAAVTAAQSKPPAPRTPAVAVLTSLPAAPPSARSAAAPRPAAPPVAPTNTVRASGAMTINSRPVEASKAGPMVAAAELPMRPTTMRDAASAAATSATGLARSEGLVKALVTRGDALLATGDIVTARLFYRRGADGGDGTAALRLGETFDPAFLAQAGLGQIGGDVQKAVYWYRRANDLGMRDATVLLKSIKPAEQP